MNRESNDNQSGEQEKLEPDRNGIFGGIDGQKIKGTKRTQDRTPAENQIIGEGVAQADQTVRQAKGEFYCRC